MPSSWIFRLAAAASLLSLSVADSDGVCYSYGVDFVDEGNYFINSNSNETFTCVSTFEGCTPGPDPAEILFVDPNGDEYICSEVQTTPSNTSMVSTCPFMKDQMISGHNMILVFGNNNGGEPYAWQRDIYLAVGPQATTISTPTVTFTITSTPVITSVITSTLSVTSTVDSNITVTEPSRTARKTRSVLPPAAFTTSTKTITRTRQAWTKELVVKTTTSTATCTTPVPWWRKPDKPCSYSPTKVHPIALETSIPPNSFRILRKSDRAVPIAYARARIEAAKARRAQGVDAARIDKRAADIPTITIDAGVPVNATVTVTAYPYTTTESTAVSITATVTLPPVTVYSGIYTAVTTLATPTKTRVVFMHKTIRTTRTFGATFTKTVVATPSGSLEACKEKGGRFGDGFF